MTGRPKMRIRIRRVGAAWKGFRGYASGRGREMFWASNTDINKVAAAMRATFPDDEMEMPPPEVIAEGLPPDMWDAMDATLEWLEANPDVNPALLTMVRRADAAEREL